MKILNNSLRKFVFLLVITLAALLLGCEKECTQDNSLPDTEEIIKELNDPISNDLPNVSLNNNDNNKTEKEEEKVEEIEEITENKKIEKEWVKHGSGFRLTSCEELDRKDVYDLCQKIFSKNKEEFAAIVRTNNLHDHLGPHNVIGVKMGLYAKNLLKAEKFEMRVESEAGTKTPISCLNDGIMVATGATLGGGKIENVASGASAATFYYEDKEVTLELKQDMWEEIRHFSEDVRKNALNVWENYDGDELFIVSYS